MSKSQNIDTSRTAKSMYAQTNNQTSDAMAGFGSQQQNSGAQSNAAFGSAYGGYQSGQQTGFYGDDNLKNLSAVTAGSAATGGYDPSGLANLQNSMQTYTGSGGFDPVQLAKLNSQEDEFVQSGGMDPNTASTINQGYTSLANTGGFTPQQEQQYVEQATQGVHNTYDTLMNQATLNRNKTGGLGGGGDQATMARQLAQEQANATLAANTGLHAQKLAGQQAGLAGLETSGTDLAKLKQGALAGQVGLATSQAQGTMQGLGQQSALQTNVAGAKQAGIGQQLGLAKDVAGNQATAAAGMGKLFTDASGNLTAEGNQILNALGLNVQSAGQLDQVLASLASNTKGPLSDMTDIVHLIMNPSGKAQ
jgi:hypothetical protein